MLRLNRKDVLEPLAKDLCLHPKQYKNKKLLVDAIVKKQSLKRTERCYNELDPCTLESLDDIHDADYIEWTQIGHRFGARKHSIVSLVRNNQFIIPWAVDFHTKTYIEANEESLDMRNVRAIQEILVDCSNETPIESVTTSFNTWFLFEVQSLVGTCSYCEGNVIEKLLNEEDMAVIFSNINNCMNNLFHTLHDDIFVQEMFYQCVVVPYIRNAIYIVNKEAHLFYLLEILKKFKNMFNNSMLFDTFFNEL